MASNPPNPASSFGAWLREMRLARDKPIRAVAAAAEMDQALLSKIELGQRWPTDKQIAAFARFFKVEATELQRRALAARFWVDYGAKDPELAAAVAVQVQKDAAAYGVNKSVNKPASRLRTKK